MRFSRAIERTCEEDVAVRVIAVQAKPDHAMVARFVERHESALAAAFGEVLALEGGAGERWGDRRRRLEAARQRQPR